jgi:hypothetical protein
MSAIIRLVPAHDYEILEKYLEDGVILIPTDVAKTLFGKDAQKLDDVELLDYNFGGEPDVYADTVCSASHYAVDQILSELKFIQDNDL